MRETELLAPAGSYEMAIAAADAGADAVYFAGKDYGARAYAPNFTKKEAARMLDELHLRGKKAYLAANTLIKHREMNASLYNMLRFFYEYGTDGVLVQDFGVLSLIRQCFPDWPIHASTQMNVASEYGARFVAKQGIKRIVAARELSISEIRDLCRNTPVEVEVFVHGALCMCYSGQCLMSSFLGGRSGNRGRCAQPCRKPYQLRDASNRILKAAGFFPLSTKDLCAIRMIPQLVEAGVASLKIEGRMKQLPYAVTVVEIYRKYLDLCLEGRWHKVTDRDMGRLLDSGNRCGFTDAYFFQLNASDMMSGESSSHTRASGKEPFAPEKKKGIPFPVFETDMSESERLDAGRGSHPSREEMLGRIAMELQDMTHGSLFDTGIAPEEPEADERKSKVPVSGYFIASEGEPVSFTLLCRDRSAYVSGDVCEPAKKRPTERDEIAGKLAPSQDMPFYFEELVIELGEGLFLPHRSIKTLKRKAFYALEKELLEAHHRTVDDTKKWEPVAAFDNRREAGGVPGLAVRCRVREQLAAISGHFDAIDRLILPAELVKDVEPQYASKIVIELPVVFRRDTAKYYEEYIQSCPDVYYEASSFDALGFLQERGIPFERVMAGSHLYALSMQAKMAFKECGIDHQYLPLELTGKEWKSLDARKDSVLVYGRVPLMYTANCMARNAGKCRNEEHRNKRRRTRTRFMFFLMDRKNTFFPVVCHCSSCTNVVYNSVPLDIMDRLDEIRELGPRFLEVSFTTENEEETVQVFERVMAGMEGKILSAPEVPFTRGHYLNPVE